jgi:hypothetical protein
MLDFSILVCALGALHFAIGGLWYSPIGFGNAWMHGLGVAQADIAEARINARAALAASAVASIMQTAILVWLLHQIGDATVMQGSALAGALAAAFSFLPMQGPRTGGRTWSVILVDGGYEVSAAAIVGGIAAWWIG